MLRDYGHTPVGLYEVMMTDTEVMTVWATDPEGHEALGRAIDAGTDDRIESWRTLSRDYLTHWREELMTPYPGTLLSRGDPPTRSPRPADLTGPEGVGSTLGWRR